MASKTMEFQNLSKEQIAVLEDNFNKISKHPEGMTLVLIAAESGLTEEETLVSTRDTHAQQERHTRETAVRFNVTGPGSGRARFPACRATTHLTSNK